MSSRTPITNGDHDDIIDTLPADLVLHFGYMATAAIIDAGAGSRSDHKYDTADEIAAYNVAYAATLTWMQS